VGRLRGHHGHLRPRVDADVLRHGPPLRRLHPRLQQPGAVPRVDRSERDRDLPRPRPAGRAAVGLRGDDGCGVQRGLPVGAARGPPRGPAAAAQRRLAEQEGPAHADRGAAPAAQRAVHRPGRRRQRRALRAAGDGRAHRLRHEPAGVHLRRPAGRDGPVLGHREVLHALPRRPRRQPRDAGRGEPGPLGGRGRQLPLAAARVDELDLPRRRRPDRPLHLQRHAAHGRQPRRPRLRRADGHHPARPAGRRRVPVRRQRDGAPRGPRAVPRLRRAEAGVPRPRPLGRARRAARRPARRRGEARARIGRQARERLPRDRDRGGPPLPGQPAARGVRGGRARRDRAGAGRGRRDPGEA
ncbi:MAG: hypothetical protein AVDCRST_MAG11-1989, partial [uncultured Gemmatimonadaceae bacterium]